MKKKIALALATIMSMSALAVSVSAEDNTKLRDYPKVNLLVEGKAVETDQPAVIVDGRTMVPVRVVAETLGSTVDWDAETKTVTFTQGIMTASMVVGDTKLTVAVDNVVSDMAVDVPASIINSRTMVPIRFLSETFGYGVEWDAETKTVNVTVSRPVLEKVESGAAVEEQKEDENSTELTADDIKKMVDELNEYCTKINASETKMSEEQIESYASYCDVIATVGSVLGTTDMDDEAEFTAANTELSLAKTGIVSLAGELGVKLDA